MNPLLSPSGDPTVPEALDIYGVPLSEFVRERDGLVRTLREEGRQEVAEAVASLRKPTIDAWALNQVARRHPGRVEELAELHRALRDARDARAWRQAAEMRNRLLEELLEYATSILEEEGHSSGGPVRDKLSRTLLAAAGDPDTERELRQGVLSRMAEISTQWPGTAIPPASPAGDLTERPPERDEEAERLEARAQELSRRAVELRQAAKRARDRLEQAREESHAAEGAARVAEKEAKEAEEQLKRARRQPR